MGPEYSASREAERAYQAALRLLAYRPRTRYELQGRLARRFSLEAVREALVLLEEQGYLDDAAFARAWRESRSAHKPRSASLIRRELQQKGVVSEVAEAAVADLVDEDSAYQAGHGRLRALHEVDKMTFHRRLRDYLKRRGFPLDVVRRTVARLWEERGSE